MTQTAPTRAGNLMVRTIATVSALWVMPMTTMLAQEREVCPAGGRLGIVAFQCASCSFTAVQDSLGRRQFLAFAAEPVVVEASAVSRIRAGDAIVAVNGVPITTRLGAEYFHFPPGGEVLLTVRRDGVNATFAVVPRGSDCPAAARADFEANARARLLFDSLRGRIVSVPPSGMATGGAQSGARAGGRGGRGGGGGGVLSSRGDSVLVSAIATRQATAGGTGGRGGMAGTLISAATTESVVARNFGFSVTCLPTACSQARTRDGTAYWRFMGYPSVTIPSAFRDALAAKAGLRDGDVIITVNGVSPLTEEGALHLSRADAALTIELRSVVPAGAGDTH